MVYNVKLIFIHTKDLTYHFKVIDIKHHFLAAKF